MRANNRQKIEELKKILQEVVDRSNEIEDYDIETLSTENEELLVNAALCNKDGVVITDCEGTYLDVFCWAKLILYPLLN